MSIGKGHILCIFVVVMLLTAPTICGAFQHQWAGMDHAINGDLYHDLKEALDDIDDESTPPPNATIVISKALTGTTNSPLTVPSNVSLMFIKGGKLLIEEGWPLTINGSIEAGLWQIFEKTTGGAGKVYIGSGVVNAVYPQWWGMVESDPSVDLGDINTKAIMAALNSGDIPVEITEGTWTFQPIITLESNDTIFAKSWNCILKLEENAAGWSYIMTNWSKGTRHDNIVLKGFALDGNGANQKVSGYINIKAIRVWNVKDLLIKDLLLHDLYGGGIAISYGTDGIYNQVIDGRVLNNTIRNTGYDRRAGVQSGIDIVGGKNILIKGNTITGVKRLCGIHMETNDSEFSVCENIRIEDNYIGNFESTAHHGIYLKNYGKEFDLRRNVVITGNQIEDVPCGGIYTVGTRPIKHLVVSNNTIYNVAYRAAHYGIQTYETSTVTGNLIEKVAGAGGIWVGQGSVVTGNLVKGCKGYGIFPYYRNIVVSGNSIVDHEGKSGIFLDSYSYGITIIGNYIDGNDDSSMIYGIEEDSGHYKHFHEIVYSSNIIKDWHTAPALIRSSKDKVDDYYSSERSLDLSGPEDRAYIFHANRDYWLIDVRYIFTEGTSKDPGVKIAIGKRSDGSTDDDYFHNTTSKKKMEQWDVIYTIWSNACDPATIFNNQFIKRGDTIFLYTTGGKTGVGKVTATIGLIPIED